MPKGLPGPMFELPPGDCCWLGGLLLDGKWCGKLTLFGMAGSGTCWKGARVLGYSLYRGTSTGGKTETREKKDVLSFKSCGCNVEAVNPLYLDFQRVCSGTD